MSTATNSPQTDERRDKIILTASKTPGETTTYHPSANTDLVLDFDMRAATLSKSKDNKDLIITLGEGEFVYTIVIKDFYETFSAEVPPAFLIPVADGSDPVALDTKDFFANNEDLIPAAEDKSLPLNNPPANINTSSSLIGEISSQNDEMPESDFGQRLPDLGNPRLFVNNSNNIPNVGDGSDNSDDNTPTAFFDVQDYTKLKNSVNLSEDKTQAQLISDHSDVFALTDGNVRENQAETKYYFMLDTNPSDEMDNNNDGGLNSGLLTPENTPIYLYYVNEYTIVGKTNNSDDVYFTLSLENSGESGKILVTQHMSIKDGGSIDIDTDNVGLYLGRTNNIVENNTVVSTTSDFIDLSDSEIWIRKNPFNDVQNLESVQLNATEDADFYYSDEMVKKIDLSTEGGADIIQIDNRLNAEQDIENTIDTGADDDTITIDAGMHANNGGENYIYAGADDDAVIIRVGESENAMSTDDEDDSLNIINLGDGDDFLLLDGTFSGNNEIYAGKGSDLLKFEADDISFADVFIDAREDKEEMDVLLTGIDNLDAMKEGLSDNTKIDGVEIAVAGEVDGEDVDTVLNSLGLLDDDGLFDVNNIDTNTWESEKKSISDYAEYTKNDGETDQVTILVHTSLFAN